MGACSYEVCGQLPPRVSQPTHKQPSRLFLLHGRRQPARLQHASQAARPDPASLPGQRGCGP